MDKLDKLPEHVKKSLIDFLGDIPVEKYSAEWRGIQAAIAMILAPNSFKDKVHVYLQSRERGSEEGAFYRHSMSIRIWPHKLQMRRDEQDWTSWSGYRTNDHFRYTFPDGKHSLFEFDELINGTSDLFCANDSDYNNDGYQHSCFYTNFTIETNVK